MEDFALERYHDRTFLLPVQVVDIDPDTQAETPVDLTGAVLTFKMGSITEETTGYEISRDDENGSFTIMVSATAMEALTAESYLFEVVAQYINGAGIS